jgi:hypothetical protein
MNAVDECRVCGIRFRDTDDVVTVDGHRLHVDCALPHVEPKRRRPGLWAAMGSRGQMAIGDVQRETPT